MNWIIKHLPELVGTLILVFGIFTITYNLFTERVTADYFDIAIESAVYVFASFGAYAVLKAVQIISEALFKDKQ